MKAIIINSCMPPAEIAIKGGIFQATPLEQHNMSHLFAQCHGNTGNGVIGFSIYKILRESGFEIELNIGSLDELSLKWEYFEQVLPKTSLVFLCLQDILRPDSLEIWTPQQMELIIRVCQAASGRLCVLSLGSNDTENSITSNESLLASRLPRETKEALSSIIDHSIAIQARTKELCLNIERAYPGKSINWLQWGCPSIYRKDINKQRLMRNLSNITSWRESSQKVLAGGLFAFKAPELFARTVYIPQSFSELLLANRLYVGDPVLSYQYSSIALTSVFATDNIITFIGTSAWQDQLSEEDFLWYTGTRLHGGIMALLEGIPTLFTGGDKRTKDFTDQYSLPLHCEILLEDAPQIISDWDWGTVVNAQREERNIFCNQIKKLTAG